MIVGEQFFPFFDYCKIKSSTYPIFFENFVKFLDQFTHSIDPFYLYALGVVFDLGCGITKDSQKAVDFFSRSAELGSTRAMNSLAVCYRNGEGIEKNVSKSFQLYQKASELGNSFAMNNLGVSYENGEGVEKKPKKGNQILSKSS